MLVHMLECTCIITTLHFQSGLISLATPASLCSTQVPLLQSSILSYSSLLTWQISQELLPHDINVYILGMDLYVICIYHRYIQGMYIYVYIICLSLYLQVMNLYSTVCLYNKSSDGVNLEYTWYIHVYTGTYWYICVYTWYYTMYIHVYTISYNVHTSIYTFVWSV